MQNPLVEQLKPGTNGTHNTPTHKHTYTPTPTHTHMFTHVYTGVWVEYEKSSSEAVEARHY